MKEMTFQKGSIVGVFLLVFLALVLLLRSSYRVGRAGPGGNFRFREYRYLLHAEPRQNHYATTRREHIHKRQSKWNLS